MAITISDTEPRVQYTASSGQTAFSVPFEFFTTADIKVYNGTSLLTYNASPSSASQYSVTGAGVSGGGAIALGGGATLNDVITIYRDLGIARSTDFPTSGAFQIDSLNTELDKIIAMIQQVERDLKFSPKAAATTSNTYNLTLPNLVANKILSVNSSGTALEFDQSITDVATVAGIASDISTLSAISSDIQAVENIASNITAVAGDATDIGAVAAKATEIGRLGTADAVADMALLGTSAVVADMALLATTDCIADMALLASSDIISDMNTLATSDIVSDLNTLATSDIVSDLNTLATSDIVSDINTLATSDIVSDLNTLATSDIVTDLNLLATSANVTNMATLGASGVVTNIASVAGSISNVNTVASNISGVNDFAARYRVASSAPSSSLDEGDLYYNTSANSLNYYNGSSWAAITTDTDVKVLVSSNDSTAGYLNGKLVAGTGISFTESNDGSNETLTITNTGEDPTALAIALG